MIIADVGISVNLGVVRVMADYCDPGVNGQAARRIGNNPPDSVESIFQPVQKLCFIVIPVSGQLAGGEKLCVGQLKSDFTATVPPVHVILPAS